MPYISKEKRERSLDRPGCAGELNYCFTKVFLEYLKKQGESYQTYNDILSTLHDPFKLPKPFDFSEPVNAIQLGAKVASVVNNYIANNRSTDYSSDLKGCFLACALEFYRRMVADYEDIKIKENGDVFPEKQVKPNILETRINKIEKEIEALGFVLIKIKEDLYEGK